MPMPPDALESLRRVNENLRAALARLRPERKHCSTIRPQDFSAMLAQLLRAADFLRHAPRDPEAAAEFEKESCEYRENLEKLRRFLPDLQLRLLAEKNRLQNAKTHVASAAAWAQASKERP